MLNFQVDGKASILRSKKGLIHKKRLHEYYKAIAAEFPFCRHSDYKLRVSERPKIMEILLKRMRILGFDQNSVLFVFRGDVCAGHCVGAVRSEEDVKYRE